MPGSALRVREALLVAGLLSVVVVVTHGQQRFGSAGLFASVALAGLADAHVPVATLVALFAGAGIGPRALVLGVLVAVSTNSVVRRVTAFVAGGRADGLRVGAGLLVGLAAAWATGLAAA